MNKILTISIGGLGDTILFSPVLKALHKTYPKAQIELLVANRLAQEAYSYAQEVSHVIFANFSYPSSLLKATSLIDLMLKARLYGKFDIGFFATGLNHRLGRFMKGVGIVNEIARAPNVPSCLTDFYCNLELAQSVDNTISEQDVFIPKTEEAEREAKNILEEHGLSLNDSNLLAVYPSIEFAHRPRWQLTKLLKVIQLIKNDGFKGKTVVVGSGCEHEEWEVIDRENIVDANLAGKLSIMASVSVISKCRLVLCNDGGLMHVAGAAGRPLVAIMPNAAMRYKPPGEKTLMVRSNLPCSGCYPKRPKSCSIAECAEDITVKKVFQACQELLKKYT